MAGQNALCGTEFHSASDLTVRWAVRLNTFRSGLIQINEPSQRVLPKFNILGMDPPQNQL
jgi:hypothetical protein